MRLRSGIVALPWLWYRLAAVAPIGPLAWKPPYVSGAALKSKKKRKLNIELPYHPTIPLLGSYPDKTIIQKVHVPQCSL